ncbi:hypothetical protein P12x_003652 [Tundrisphaera lichenicola]|uniref:hypothetical protein n=1 Tax=Tundrisphaera lichenicola TaxID=2029860 RepID=UPI003EC02F69
MDGRSFNVFLRTFVLAALGLFLAWFAVDGLVHLDESFAAVGPDAGLGRVTIRHFSGMVGLHGGTLMTSIGLGSGLVAVARARRSKPLS